MSLLYEWLDSAASVRRRGKFAQSALIYRDTYLSWYGLVHRVDRRARELKTFGIEAGDWVGLMLGSVPEFMVLALALSKLEAVVVPLDPTIGGRDLDMVLAAAQLRALITRPNASPPLAAPANPTTAEPSSSKTRISVENRRRLSGTLLTCTVFKRLSPKQPAESVPEVVLFTLDSGGDPKGVIRERRHLEGVSTSVARTLDVDANSLLCAATGLHTSQGFDLGLCTALSRHTGLILDDEMVVPRLAKMLAEQQLDILAATPAVFAAMTRLPTARPCPSKRTLCVSSGAPLTPSVARVFRRRFGVPLLSCYQAVETGPVSLDREGEHPDTVGRPFFGVDVRVATSSGAVLPPGQAGSVWVRSAGVSAHVVPPVKVRRHGDEIPISRCTTDGWLRTGDRGILDREGRLTLLGREDDLVKVDGRRVALGEVEGCLEAYAHVRSAEARVEHDEDGGARVIARVFRGGPCTSKQIIDHCTKHLAPHKVPARVEFGDPG